MPTLEKEAKLLRDTFNYDAQVLDAATVKRDFVDDKEAAGAMHEPEGIGIHAGKLAFGYLEKARRLGVKVHTSSPVIGWTSEGDVHYIKTPGGIVKPKPLALRQVVTHHKGCTQNSKTACCLFSLTPS